MSETLIEQLRREYCELVGEEPTGFICPITLVDVTVNATCMGHVLNKALSQASSKTVLQRSDVDNYFGRTIEPDLIKFLNFPVLSPKDRYAAAGKISITFNSGEKSELFLAGLHARKQFNQIDLLDKDGKVVVSPYVKKPIVGLEPQKDVEVECLTIVNDGALIGSLLKSAWLALFDIFGYRYVLMDATSIPLRLALSRFFSEKGTKLNSFDYFGEFKGAAMVALEGALDTIPDTLEGGTLLFHFARGNIDTGLWFAVSCIFRINGKTIVVTLPASRTTVDCLESLSYYRCLLKDRNMPHTIQLAQFKEDHFEIQGQPLSAVYRHDLKK